MLLSVMAAAPWVAASPERRGPKSRNRTDDSLALSFPTSRVLEPLLELLTRLACLACAGYGHGSLRKVVLVCISRQLRAAFAVQVRFKASTVTANIQWHDASQAALQILPPSVQRFQTAALPPTTDRQEGSKCSRRFTQAMQGNQN